MARARKSKVIPFTRFKITSPQLPGLTFFSFEGGWTDGVDRACKDRKALNEYIIDGCDIALRETLTESGWDRASIELAVKHPHLAQPTGYGWPYADAA
jgi:hypothetical protein